MAKAPAKKEGTQMTTQNEGKEAKPGTAIALPAIAPMAKGSLTVASMDETSAAFGEAIQGQERQEPPGITLIRIDHKMEMFTINGEPTDAIEGYPINYMQARAWWKKGYKAGEHSPPDCASADMLKPLANMENVQADSCMICKLSAWGSAPDGSGQACKVTTFLFILNPDFGPPGLAALLAPPSSIRNIIGTPRSPGYLQRAKQFKNQTTGRPANYYELVWTRFTVARASDNHCVIEAVPVAVAPGIDEARAIAAVRGQFLVQMQDLRGRIDEIAENDGE
jgi:hypothetical protein